ncbi:MAG TPA: hypothetical protein VGJ20_01410 [Xanthobacteraceae bacterium]
MAKKKKPARKKAVRKRQARKTASIGIDTDQLISAEELKVLLQAEETYQVLKKQLKEEIKQLKQGLKEKRRILAEHKKKQQAWEAMKPTAAKGD